ncbi:hypothetical protein BCU39_020245 [Vibrio cyclitrophicus]|uniref:hypothetical protein n=1 Tax=Vibrio cyclitrophicus TaxID=47951 RepID=UPI000C84973F|nr:hypothetical protein [Vibrio cyclitrophicus]PMI71672.1 hypothetical protein BCU39_19410 [Vibrio cyclitrophicus]
MTELTRDYIREHMVDIHTHESFSRALVEMVLNQSLEKEPDNNKIEMEAKITVRPVESRGCINIELNVGLGSITYHQKV